MAESKSQLMSVQYSPQVDKDAFGPGKDAPLLGGFLLLLNRVHLVNAENVNPVVASVRDLGQDQE